MQFFLRQARLIVSYEACYISEHAASPNNDVEHESAVLANKKRNRMR